MQNSLHGAVDNLERGWRVEIVVHRGVKPLGVLVKRATFTRRMHLADRPFQEVDSPFRLSQGTFRIVELCPVMRAQEVVADRSRSVTRQQVARKHQITK